MDLPLGSDYHSQDESALEDYNSNIPCNSLSKGLSTPRRCSYCQKIMFFKAYRCKHCRYRCHKKCASHTPKRSNSCHAKQYTGEEHWTKVLQANEVNSNVLVVPCHGKRGSHSRRESRHHSDRHHTNHDRLSPRRVGGSAPHSPTEPRQFSPKDFYLSYPPVSSSPQVSPQAQHYHSTTPPLLIPTPPPTHATPHERQPSPQITTTPANASAKSGRRSRHSSTRRSKDHLESSTEHRNHKHNRQDTNGNGNTGNQGNIKETNIFTSLYARFCQWVANARKESHGGRITPRHNRSRSSSIHSNRSQDLLQLLSGMPEDYHHGNCMHASLSSEDSELCGSLHQPCYSSTCSSLTITSTSTATSADNVPNINETLISSGAFTSGLQPSWIPPMDGGQFSYFLSPDDKRTRHSNLTFTISCPLRTKQPSISKPDLDKASLCATWPPTGRKRYHKEFSEEIILDDLRASHAFSSIDDHPGKDETNLRESAGEFSIPFKDLRFGDIVRKGRRRDIYKGRWHGEVMIHVYRGLPDEEVGRFWQEVTKLSMIRHENVSLFMGACLDPPDLAVITSVQKGVSLYEQIHLHSNKTSLHDRINIVRQIAQGMGYLHAKGLVMCKLNSRNIYLEPKVKLSLMDYGMSEKFYDRPSYGCVPRGHLTYAAPELLSSLKVEPPRLVTETPYSSQTDVYAFGTILFELMANRFPFRGCPAEVIIWHVVKGRRQSLKDLRCNSNLKLLIEQCWAKQPDERPAFSNINKELQQNGALHKRHSSSEPERMNRSGIDKGAGLFT